MSHNLGTEYHSLIAILHLILFRFVLSLVVSTHMGKSPSLRDIFSLKKSSSNTNFTKPGQFLEHLRTHTPSIVEIQRLQHILESRQWSFVQKFVDKGGAMALFSILSGYSRKRQ